MTVLIEVVCDRCKAVSEGHVTQKGQVRPDQPGWRYVSRDINLCAGCSEDFEAWRCGSLTPTTTETQVSWT